MKSDKKYNLTPVSNTPLFRNLPNSEILKILQQNTNLNSSFVTELKKLEIHPSLHVFLSNTKPSIKHNSFHKVSIYSSGKGMTDETAQISALSETIERQSGTFTGTEESIIDSYDNLQSCINPNDLQQFSELQIDNRLLLNKYYAGFCKIPPRFNPKAKVRWSPARSISSGKTCYVPTAWAFYDVPQEKDLDFFCASSNGCAAGSTQNEAILHGLLELIERDGIACWWYSRAKRPAVIIDSSWSDACRITNALSELGRSVWVLDATTDLGIPVVIAISHRTKSVPEEIVMGFGSHFNIKLAVERALCEIVQLLPEATINPPQENGYYHFNPSITYWWRNASVEQMPYLLPDTYAKPFHQSKFSDTKNISIDDALSELNCIIESAGLESYVIDQTRSEMGLSVVRTIVPGLRRIQPAFGPGRLFQTPVKLGWLPNSISEHELNPMPLPT